MEDFLGKRVLVIGAGMTGQSAAAYLSARGASVCVADESLDAAAPPLPPGVELRRGALPDPADYDLVVPSPGVPAARYRERSRDVAGDVELAGRALEVPIVAVTGTNGKSTCVRLIEALLRASGLRAAAAGNVGEPVLGLVGQPLDVAVIEVSSFQLESVSRLRPRVAVWLNASPDHLDRHGDFEGYCRAKARLFARQQASDVAVLPANDPELRAHAATKARTLLFRSDGPLPEGAMLEGDDALVRFDGRIVRVPLGSLPASVHRENALAALLVVHALEADPTRAAAGMLGFRALPHRMEAIAEVDGASFIDDSKATNPGAAAAALHEQSAPVIWIAGGRDKGLDYRVLAEAARGRVRAALLIGEAAQAIGHALEGVTRSEQIGELDAAVARAHELAEPGDVVLLSPACASFDQFRNFEERGERFRSAVDALTKAGADDRKGDPR
jgi:UDP-N-acetylmuramoylalanine--D-glutamate ligase